MTRLGYQIPNFTYPDTTGGDIFSSVVAQAKAAEEAGFDRVMVMDHFYQLPGIGAPDEPMFECYTLLSAIAQHTSSVRLSSLVTGNTYRHPTLLAQDHHGLGSRLGRSGNAGGSERGWFELEHQSLGYEFGTFTDRFEKLEESLQIVIPMLRGESITPQRQALPGHRCREFPASGFRHPDHDRRQRREEDAPHGGAVRR